MSERVIGIDIGGTCTDCVVLDSSGSVTLAKAFSTPPDFSRGIMDALAVASEQLEVDLATLLAETRLFLHSTTVAENAVVDGTMARAGLITNRGFEDTLFATRGGYGRWSGLTEDEKRNPVETDKLPPLVPRPRIVGVRERTDSSGTQLVAHRPDDIAERVSELLATQVDAIGVCLLWSFANPDAENAVAAAVRELAPGTFLTLSHEIAPVVGEYERTSTVALNARLGPVVSVYLDNLRDSLQGAGFDGTLLVMQAHGGLVPFEEARERPVGMIESGPVSGVVGCRDLGRRIGSENIIAADMGGTTFKVGVVREGRLDYQRESMVLRYHYALPKLDVVSLGLAGGSIVSVDERTGTPRIGPRSAGSYPGPVCYGHGGEEPTISDVDAILGYLNPDFFLDGRAALDIERARSIFSEKVAEPLGLDTSAAAGAMYRLANSLIHDLLHRTTVQRGLDPRRFALFSFGGTAGMHVGAYGGELGVERIVVPHSAAVHGAYGLVTSDVAHEDQITRPMRAPAPAEEVAAVFGQLERRARRQLESEGFTGASIVFDHSIEMRYRRQVHVLTTPLAEGDDLTAERLERTVATFERLYEERYGKESAFREAGIELVSFRLRATGRLERPTPEPVDLDSSDPSAGLVGEVEAWIDADGALGRTSGYDFAQLVPGNTIPGPAIIWTPITTLVVGRGKTASLDGFHNIIVE
ncbi:MAG: hydantoinase/oxoprolinase family protein [Gaiellaceae bacterium]